MWIIRVFKDESDMREWKLNKVLNDVEVPTKTLGYVSKTKLGKSYTNTYSMGLSKAFKTESGASRFVNQFIKLKGGNPTNMIKWDSKFYFLRDKALCTHKLSKEEYYDMIDSQIYIIRKSSNAKIEKLVQKKRDYVGNSNS